LASAACEGNFECGNRALFRRQRPALRCHQCSVRASAIARQSLSFENGCVQSGQGEAMDGRQAASVVSPASLPLAGVLVVALEQAVAAPYCTSRLADAGARVIKIERREGDFARGYDRAVHGESSYFVWINRGKESIALDLKEASDRSLIERMLARADVFVQNLAPGAVERLGLGSAALRERYERLVTCDISGYGDSGRFTSMKAYDLLVQAESGLISVSGAPGQGVESLGRIGVSLCDINAGLNALVGIQQALLVRTRTGRGSSVKVSLFDTAAELMSVPYLQARYGGKAPERVGLKHPTIAPYGAFTCADGRDIVISIQNEREWADFCREVLRDPALLEDPRCASNAARCAHREWVDGRVADVFARLTSAQVIDRLTTAQTAYGNVNSVNDLIEHPQLRTRRMPVGHRTIDVPASPWRTDWDGADFPQAPHLDQHGDALRAEFAE
jgi:itaconate CoA-transferase